MREILLAELKAVPKDAWGLAGALGTVLACLSFTGLEFQTGSLNWLLEAYTQKVALLSAKILGYIGLDLSIFESSVLAWFAILYAIFLRGMRLDYFRIDLSPAKPVFNKGVWLVLATFGPLIIIGDVGLPGWTKVWVVAGMTAIHLLLVGTLYSKFRLVMNWFRPFESAHGGIIQTIIIVLSYFVIVSFLSVAAEAAVGGDRVVPDSIATVVGFMLYSPMISISMVLFVYAFLFSIYIAIAIPRSLFGAILLLSALLITDIVLSNISV